MKSSIKRKTPDISTQKNRTKRKIKAGGKSIAGQAGRRKPAARQNKNRRKQHPKPPRNINARAKKAARKTARATSRRADAAARKTYNAARRARRRQRHGRRNGFLNIFLPTAAAFLFAVIGFGVWYFSFDKLNPEDYVAVTYSGYDTRGTASLSIRETEEYETFWEDAQINLLSENGSLKNGDHLDVCIIYDPEQAKQQKLRIQEDSFQIEVNGLPEGKELSADDIFSGVHIDYEGIAPELTLTVTNESDDPFLQTVIYEIAEPKTFYDVGDTVRINASFSEEDAIAHEYAVSLSEEECSRMYTVENTDCYLRDASELSADLIQTLNETAATLFGDANEYGLRIFSEANLMPIWVNGKNTFVWSNPRLLSAYLNVLKPEYFEAQSHNNDIKLVYTVRLSQADGVGCDAKVVVQFTNLIRRADGTYDLSLDSGKIIAASYRTSHIKDLVTDSYHEEYTAEKLDLS